MKNAKEEVTALLKRARASQDAEAREQLYRAVEGELRKIAGGLLPPQGAGHTLQATVLLDLAFVRLVMGDGKAGESRSEFYRIASGVMRRILVDHARRKRPDRLADEQLANVPGRDGSAPDERLQRADRLLALDRALDLLRQDDAEAADLFEVHYFGGLRLSLGATPEEWIAHIAESKTSVDNTAVLGIKRATAYRILHRARAFLRRELQDDI